MLRGLGAQKAKGASLCSKEEAVSLRKDLLEVFHPVRDGAELQGLLAGLFPLDILINLSPRKAKPRLVLTVLLIAKQKA